MRKEDNKIYISIGEVIDYCHCPMLYKFKHIDSLDKQYSTVLDQYKTCMQKCIYNFFTQAKFDDISISNLKTSFGSYWIKSKSLKNIIYSEPVSWRNTHNEKRKDGINIIVKFYNQFKHNVGLPIIINKPYKAKITNNLFLEGNFEVIREITTGEEKHIDILNIVSAGKTNTELLLEKDLITTSSVYAFRQLFNVKEDSISFFNIDKGKVSKSYRDESDFDILTNTVINVYRCINNNVFYMCPTKKCLNCAYKTLCVKI